MSLGTQMQNFAATDLLRIPTFNEMRLEGWSIIATNPANPISSLSKTAANSDFTCKSQHIASCDSTRIALLFANWANIQPNQSIQPNYNSILVGASLQKVGSSATDETGILQPIFFKNGKNKISIDPAALVTSEPAFFGVAKNERFYIRTYFSCALPAAPASAPTITVTNGTGGFLVNTFTYYVIIKYVFPDGVESATSTYASGTITTANTGIITVTSPANPGGAAIGYKVYMSVRSYSGNPTGALYNPVSGVVPFGLDFVIKLEPSVNDYRLARPSGALYGIGGGGLLGGTTNDSMDTGEGYIVNNDMTLTTNNNQTLGYGSYTNLYWPIAIIGKTKTYQKSVALIGDSIQAGTGDCGYSYNNGGFGTRAVCNQLSLAFDTTQNPYYGYVRVPLGGESAAQFALTLSNNQFFRGRAAVTELATNVISNYGTNDISGTLSTLKTNILAIAKWYMQRGIKFFQCTLLPKTSSTDGFQTVSGQTTLGTTETNRLAFNLWIRDLTSTGFIQQAAAAASVSSVYVGIIDVCKYIEVNSSNVLTQNGGFWIVPTAPFTPITGTLTSVSAGYDFTDNTKTWVRNAYKGADFIATSGAQINKRYNIGYNTATGNINTYFNSIGGTPAIGDAYKITVLGTIDGTHPSSTGHILMAQAVQEAFTQFI